MVQLRMAAEYSGKGRLDTGDSRRGIFVVRVKLGPQANGFSSKVERDTYNWNARATRDVPEAAFPGNEPACALRRQDEHHLRTRGKCLDRLFNQVVRRGTLDRNSTDAAQQPANRTHKNSVFPEPVHIHLERPLGGEQYEKVPVGCMRSDHGNEFRAVGELPRYGPTGQPHRKSADAFEQCIPGLWNQRSQGAGERREHGVHLSAVPTEAQEPVWTCAPEMLSSSRATRTPVRNSLPIEIAQLQHFARGVRTATRSGLLVLASLLVVSSAAAAQPGAGPLVLRMPSSPRMLGMGNAGLASTDADALFYNPALLFNARGLAVSMQRYGSAATAGALANVVVVGSMNIGVGAQVLNWSAAPMSYRELMRLGTTQLGDSGAIPASSVAVTLGIARAFKGKRVAVSAKYAEDRLGAAHDGTLAFDVGVMGPALWLGTFSFAFRNIGQGLRIAGEEGRLPTQLAIGWGGTYNNFEKFDTGYQTQLTVDRDGFVTPAAGFELGYVPIEGVSFTARAGLRLPRESDASPVTGGLGVTVDRISIDYAIEPFRGGGPVSHRIGLRVK